MQMTVKFYKCETCGNIITKLKDSSVNVVCCGNPMKELILGEVDAAVEKHVPAVTIERDKVTVKVGSVPHPMVENHYIEFIALETVQGLQIKYLESDYEAAEAVFALADDDKAVCAYAYCNLHGLWKKELV